MRHKLVLTDWFSFLSSCSYLPILGPFCPLGPLLWDLWDCFLFLHPLGPLLWDHWECFYGTGSVLFLATAGSLLATESAFLSWPLQHFWPLQLFFFFGRCNTFLASESASLATAIFRPFLCGAHRLFLTLLFSEY